MGNSRTIINDTVNDLEEIEIKLNSVDEEDLDDEQKNTLADQINEVSLNLLRLRTAQIEALSAEFKARENELSRITSDLRSNLENTKNTISVIGVVDQALGAITNIIALI